MGSVVLDLARELMLESGFLDEAHRIAGAGAVDLGSDGAALLLLGD